MSECISNGTRYHHCSSSYSTFNHFASRFSRLPSGKNFSVLLGTVTAENLKFWSNSLRHFVRKWRYTFLVYFTSFPDLSVRSHTLTVFSKTISACWNATPHCSHLRTLFEQRLLSSRPTSSNCFPEILSGSSSSRFRLSFFGCTWEMKEIKEKKRHWQKWWDIRWYVTQ